MAALFAIEIGDFEMATRLYDTFLVKDGGKTGPATPLGEAIPHIRLVR
jgi:hypothetical protein